MPPLETRKLAELADTEADDVEVAGGADRLVVAYTRTALASEVVVVRTLAAGGEWGEERLLLDGARAFRPSIGTLGDAAVVAACVARGERFSPGGWVIGSDGAPRDWDVGDSAGACYQVAVAGDADAERALVAWEERRGAIARVRLGWLDREGRLVPTAAIEGDERSARSPALARAGGSAWLAWVEASPRAPGRVRLARLEDGRPVETGGAERLAGIDLDPHPAPQEAPAIALSPAGEPLVAWHTSARGPGDADVTRWLRLARVHPERGEVDLICPEPEALGPTQAGEDQAWEFPALACAADVTWLAGRSSHGFHLACIHHDGSWTERAAISAPGWGGRGRRLSLRAWGDRAILARREPEGVVVTELPRPRPAARDARPAPDDPIELPPEPTPVPASARRRAQRGAWEPRVLFGDLHQHTAHSDGAGSAEDLWLLARDRRNLDFAAITDHDRFCRRAIGPATWKYMCDVAGAFDEPGRFAAFPAYEFTGPRHPGPGHKCVYFGDRVPERIPEKDVEAIFAVVRELGGIAVPHHTGWTGTDAEHHDPSVQPVWEICSVHGCYECHPTSDRFPPRADCILEGHFIRDALEAGLRFGLIGSTDTHGLLWHHGVSPKRDPFSAGLAAVVGAEPERNSILERLRARRSYATTGARIRLWAEIEGAPLGSELPADARGKLGVTVEGTAPLSRVEVVRRSGLEQLDVAGARCEASVAVALEGGLGWDYLYIKVVQTDGETAFSSPFWLGPGGAP